MKHTAHNCNALQHTPIGRSFQGYFHNKECASTHCNTLQHTATHYSTLKRTATHTHRREFSGPFPQENVCCNTLQHTATHCNTLLHPATHYKTHPRVCFQGHFHSNVLQHCTTHCDTLQHTVTHYSTQQHMHTHPSAKIIRPCNAVQRSATL